MIQTILPHLEDKRTDETRLVEEALRDGGFEQVNAYRYNLASIRVRVIDRRFEGLKFGKRVDMIEPNLERLPERTQADIIELYAFAPSEVVQSPKICQEFIMNLEFEDPSPSML